MRIRGYVFLLLVLPAFAGCSIPSDPPVEIEATTVVADDLGRAVTVPVKVNRVVSLAPSVTEMIFAVGAGDKLVGVTTFCNYPDEANAIQKVGDTMTPNIESIIALKPQVVFVSTASQLEAFMVTLAQQNIAVFVTDAKTVDNAFEDLVTIGQILGKGDEASNLAVSLESRAKFYWHARNRDPQSTPPMRVFVQLSNDGLYTVGKDSYVTQMVEYAGGESVTKDVPTAFPALSKEAALAMNPDVIILSDSEDNREPNIAFKTSSAVRNGRVYRINADIISRPGPRLADAIEEMVRLLHGEK